MYVITHKEFGIYLGSCMGFGWWTMIDPVGQDAAVVFSSRKTARDHILSWEEANNPRDYKLVKIEPDVERGEDLYASITQLKKTGLQALMGKMEEDYLRLVEPLGGVQ